MKRKKSILLLIAIILYGLFWWWFYGERDIAIKGVQEQNTHEVPQAKEEHEDTQDGVEFASLGNFWLEIDTEKVKIKAPVVEGVTDDKLAQGIGHHTTTALPNDGQGTVVLSGHRWKFGKNPAYKVFENLDKLTQGDLITLHYNNQTYIYEVTNQRETDAKDLSVLHQDDTPHLIVYTCTPKYTSFKRLVYKAQLVRVINDFDK